jgi:hypothetical protein
VVPLRCPGYPVSGQTGNREELPSTGPKDLQEIKASFRSDQPPPPPAAAPQEAVLSLDGAPVKGEKTAKVALIDFTDYQ